MTRLAIALCLLLPGAFLINAPQSGQADEVVYENDFNGPLKSSFPEWSSSPIRYFNNSTPKKQGSTLGAPPVTTADTPNGKQRYLGPFGGPEMAENTRDFNRTRVEQTIRLRLEKLPAHKSVTVAFDLYVISSWDGNNLHYGPDRWELAVEHGPTLLSTTFSNNPKTGDYDLSNQDYPKKNSPFQSGASEIDKLGSQFFGDAIYKLSFMFEHDADALTLNFHSDLFEGKGIEDEAWGLDNVKITAHTLAQAKPSPREPSNKSKSSSSDLPPPARTDEVVYTNDFNGPTKSSFPEWSSSPITYFNSSTPKQGSTLDAPKVMTADSRNGKQCYLGPFGGPTIAENTKDFNRTRVQQTIRLKLDKLPAHKSVTVAFDLYVISSWDGNNPHYGPDRWELAVEDGPTLLSTTFSNNPKTGKYDLSNQDYPKKNSKYQSKNAGVNQLGSKWFGDAIYKLSFTFDHDADAIALDFHSDLFEGKGTEDEAWGLDNVKITAHAQAAKEKSKKRKKEKD